MAKRKATPKKVAESKPAPERAKGSETVADEIQRLCNEFREGTLKKREVEDEQKARQKALDKVGGRLVELMTMSSLKPPFYPEGGGRVSIKSDINVTQTDKDALCHSLEALGLEDLIQPTINTNSLKSAIKQRLDEHKELPQGVEIKPYQKAVFTTS